IVPGRPILPGGLVDGAMRTLVLGTPPPNQPLLVTPLGRPAEAVAVYERRLSGIQREGGGTNGRLGVTNIRLGHLEELAEQLVDLVGNGFCDLREDNRMIRASCTSSRPRCASCALTTPGSTGSRRALTGPSSTYEQVARRGACA